MDSVKRFSCVVLWMLAACPADDGSAGGTETDGTDASTSPSTTSPSTTSSASATTSPSTTDATTSTTTDPTGETTTTGEDSTTGPTLPGTCVGLDVVGTLGEVAGLDGAMVDPTCSTTVAGCGGDVVGTWTVQSTCGWEDTPNFFDDMCPGAEMTVTSGSITGTRTFDADMTFAFDIETVVELDVSLDAMSCYGVDCPTLETALEADGAVATCMDAGGGACDCTLTATTPNMTTGTWATADTALVLTTAEGDAVMEYCVTDDRLETWTGIAEPTTYEEACADEMDCADALGNLSEFYVCVLP